MNTRSLGHQESVCSCSALGRVETLTLFSGPVLGLWVWVRCRGQRGDGIWFAVQRGEIAMGEWRVDEKRG